jgi:hypothetical protein
MALIILEIRPMVGEEIESGIPRRIARAAAREKLSTDVMDMTVDARQRLNALRREERGAGEESSRRDSAGLSEVRSAERILKTMRDRGMIGK